MKGRYEHTDLNRVGEAVQEIADALSGYGYTATVNPKTDWTMNDTPTPGQRAAYIADVAALKAAFYGSVPLPGSIAGLSVSDANNIERLLLEIEALIDSMAETLLYSGSFYAGEDMQAQLFTGVI